MKSQQLLLTFLVLLAFTVYSQDEESNKTFKPKKNNLSFEVNFIPFSSSGPISIQGIKGRYFVSDKLAVNVHVNFSSDKINEEYPYKFEDLMVFDSEEGKTSTIGLGSGVEYHIFNSKRISPYFGIRLGYENKSASYKQTIHSYDYYIDGIISTELEAEGGWYGYQFVGYDQFGNPIYSYSVYQRGFSSIAAALVLGTDVYITKHFYVGVEIGLEYRSISKKEVIIKEDGNIEYKFPKTTDTSMGFVYNNAIRLGFWF
jgi:hypothetical protein